MIFSIIVFLYYNYYGNLIQEPEGVVEEMILDAKGVSTSLMSSGLPEGWNTSTVQRIGLTDNSHSLNATKLDSFVNMTYKDAKRFLSTRFEIYFFLQDGEGNQSYRFGLTPTNEKSLVQVMRLVLLDDNIYRMVIHLWEK